MIRRSVRSLAMLGSSIALLIASALPVAAQSTSIGANISTGGTLIVTGDATMQSAFLVIGEAVVGSISDNSNLTVHGTVFSDGNTLVLDADNTTGATVTVQISADGSAAPPALRFDGAAGNWQASNDGTTYGDIVINGVTSDLSLGGDLTVSGAFTVDSGTLSLDSTTNRVGINESSPDTTLHITGSGAVSHLALETTNDANGAMMRFLGNGGGLRGLSAGARLSAQRGHSDFFMTPPRTNSISTVRRR